MKRGYWVYVLHHPDDEALALEVKLGLNRLGYQIWVRERDEPDKDPLLADADGMRKAAFVVVLESPALAANKSANLLVSWIEEGGRLPKKPRFINVMLEPGKSVFPVHAKASMHEEPWRLVNAISEEIAKFPDWFGKAGALTGKHGPYALLSYQWADADKAAAVRESLAEAGIEAWDYAVSPREPMAGYDPHAETGKMPRQIPAAIKSAKAVLFILTSDWIDSPYCRQEYEQAKRSRRRRIWLRFDSSDPLEKGTARNLIECQGRGGRTRGLASLRRSLSEYRQG